MSKSNLLNLWSKLYKLENEATSVASMQYWRKHQMHLSQLARKIGWLS